MLAETLALYNGLFRTIRIERRFDGTLPPVRIDVEQIRRVVINLVDNAVEALGGSRRRGAARRRGRHHRRRDPARPAARRGARSSSPTTVPASRRPTATSCSCRTTRPSGAAAASAWRSSAASSPSTAAASKWRTTSRRAPGSSSSCRCEERGRMKASVLIVDDEAGVRSALSGVLRDEGYQVEAVESGEACLERADAQRRTTSIVLDIWLPGLDGLGHARAAARSAGRRAGRDDLRARQHRVGGARDQDGRVRLRREAAVAREDRARGRQRGPPAAAGGGEPRAARARRSPPRRWSARATSCSSCASRSRWRRRPTAAC